MFEENIMPAKAKTVTVSSYLAKQFNSNSDIDWEKLKTQVIGLPVNERLLVNKVNVENIIWQEVIDSSYRSWLHVSSPITLNLRTSPRLIELTTL